MPTCDLSSGVVYIFLALAFHKWLIGLGSYFKPTGVGYASNDTCYFPLIGISFCCIC